MKKTVLFSALAVALAHAQVADTRAQMISPAPGSTLPGSTVTFTWTAAPHDYFLRVGTQPFGTELFNAVVRVTSVTLVNMPTNGGRIYVDLYTNSPGGKIWQEPFHYEYIAAGTSVPAPVPAPAPPPAPAIAAAGIVNGASFQPVIAPGGFVTIFGRNFTDKEYTWDTAIPDGRTLPAALGGVQVRINGKSAYVNYASPKQINVLAPPDTAAGSVLVEVVTANGSVSSNATMAQVAPGLFAYSLGTKLLPAALIANSATMVAPAGALAGVTSRPARAGEFLQLYATGLGPTADVVPAGQVLTRDYPVADLSQVRASIGGLPAQVVYAGMTFAGVFQVNVQVPDGVPTGDLPVVLSIAGQSTQANAVLPFQL